MNRLELEQYINIYQNYENIISQLDDEIDELYEDISPVMTYFDGESIKKGSVSVERYVEHIIDAKEEITIRKRYVDDSYQAVKRAIETLSQEEQEIVDRSSLIIPYSLKNKLMNALKDVIDKTPSLQRKMILTDIMDVSEWDNLVDGMSDEELLMDYWDKSELYDIPLNNEEQIACSV